MGRPLVGGFSFHDVSGMFMISVAHSVPGGIQARGMRRRPLQAWVSRSGGRTPACDPHALGGAQCGEQRRPDLKHIKTTRRAMAASHSGALGVRWSA